MKKLFHLDRFSFVNKDGLIYTADEGIISDTGLYPFQQEPIDEPFLDDGRRLYLYERCVWPGSRVSERVVSLPFLSDDRFSERHRAVLCYPDAV